MADDYKVGSPQVLLASSDFDPGVQGNFPYMPPISRALYVPPGGGACDPQMRDVSQRLLPYRYATAAFRFSVTAAGGPMTLETSDKNLFVKGFDEADQNTGFSGVLSQLETNAPQNGALVQNGQMYYCVGIGLSVQTPFAVAAGASASGDRTYPSWLDDYSEKLVRAINDTTWAEMRHGQSPCKYGLGPLNLWGKHAGQDKSHDSIPGQFWFLSTVDASSSSTDGNQGAVLTLHGAKKAIVGNNATIPTEVGDVIVPVQAILYGVPVCTSTGGTIGDSTLRDQMRSAIVGAAQDIGVTPQALVALMAKTGTTETNPSQVVSAGLLPRRY